MPRYEPAAEEPVDWRKLHAFGWPAGSVRALMALLIFGTLWGHPLLRPEQEVPESLRDVLFIILGHYFAVRSRHDPLDEPGPPPLYLPRGSVRLILLAGFVAVEIALYRRGQMAAITESSGLVTLVLVAGFLLGVVLQKVMTWWSGGNRPLPRWVEDGRATISLAAAVLMAILVWNQIHPFVPESLTAAIGRLPLKFKTYGPEHLLAAVVGFYFGSRS
jgi:hypothetical protein